MTSLNYSTKSTFANFDSGTLLSLKLKFPWSLLIVAKESLQKLIHKPDEFVESVCSPNFPLKFMLFFSKFQQGKLKGGKNQTDNYHIQLC